VDLKAYSELYDTLLDSGFSRESEGIAMSADLDQMYYPQKERDHIRIMSLDEDHKLEFIDFIQKYYPGDCATRAIGVIENGSTEQIFIATTDLEIAGYAMYSAGEGPMEFAPGERFGCFEVLDRYQSMGIGSALLSATLMAMKGNGIHKAYFLWTGERAKKLYDRFGFKETRRFQILNAKL
jgi:Acetyltransferases